MTDQSLSKFENTAHPGAATVGIIMDGNRRWAKKHARLAVEGHRFGYDKLKEVLRWSKETGVKNVIVYAFSTENWKRAADEVGTLMSLLRYVCGPGRRELIGEKVRVTFAGTMSALPADVQKLAAETEADSAGFTGNESVHLVVCLSYGGREEILRAANALLLERKNAAAPGEILAPITEAEFSSHLYTAGIPDPDLIIRTSGEYRLSGFLPWQSVYSELFFTETLWPDFTKEEYFSILEQFRNRSRRMGK